MPILACLISFLLAASLMHLLGQPNDGAGLRPVPTTGRPLACDIRTTGRAPVLASCGRRGPKARK